MNETIVIKLGGSVVTHKNRSGETINRHNIHAIAQIIKDFLDKNSNFQIILIHGAGGAGHQLAKKHSLTDGVTGDEDKNRASLQIRIANQRLNLSIIEELFKCGLKPASIHTASSVFQANTINPTINYQLVDYALSNNHIPIMYGEMVYDKYLGMSVCSGDILAKEVARYYEAKKMIFLTDVDGLYDKDPYKYKNAVLIKNTTLENLEKFNISGSHNTDVSGGLLNKIRMVKSLSDSSLEIVQITNGSKLKDLTKETGTIIKLK